MDAESPKVKPCPFDCGATIKLGRVGLVKHERAPGQCACPLNNAVTDIRTWNRRPSHQEGAPDTNEVMCRAIELTIQAVDAQRHIPRAGQVINYASIIRDARAARSPSPAIRDTEPPPATCAWCAKGYPLNADETEHHATSLGGKPMVVKCCKAPASTQEETP